MKRKKRSVTLIEIMIVILLIGLIGGALAYNMRGSLDKGKAFKTEQNFARIQDILMLEYAKSDKTLQDIVREAPAIIKQSKLVKKPDDLLKDGWNGQINISIKDDDIVTESNRYTDYKNKNS